MKYFMSEIKSLYAIYYRITFNNYYIKNNVICRKINKYSYYSYINDEQHFKELFLSHLIGRKIINENNR